MTGTSMVVSRSTASPGAADAGAVLGPKGWARGELNGAREHWANEPAAPDLEEIRRWEDLQVQFSRLRLPWGTESAEVLAAVAAHRAYWRPVDRVRVLILSESHVLTRRAELAAHVPLAVFGHPAAPSEFVRLVYCLGYGERDLVQGHVQENAGTPQFWKLLAAGVDESLAAQVVHRSESDLHRRLAAKLTILKTLKERGVWLLDVCPVALYASGQPKPRMAVLKQAFELAWQVHARAAIATVAPQSILIVGKMVHDAIGDRLRAMLGPTVPVHWIYQPQARRPAAEHQAGLERLQTMCRVGD